MGHHERGTSLRMWSQLVGKQKHNKLPDTSITVPGFSPGPLASFCSRLQELEETIVSLIGIYTCQTFLLWTYCLKRTPAWGLPWWSSDWLQAPSAGSPGLIPGQGTGSHMPQVSICMLQLKMPYAVRKIEDPKCYNFPNKEMNIKKRENIAYKELLGLPCWSSG